MQDWPAIPFEFEDEFEFDDEASEQRISMAKPLLI
jgi:hypothetical protein